MPRALVCLLLLGTLARAADDPASRYEDLLAHSIHKGVHFDVLRPKRAVLDAYLKSLETATPGFRAADEEAFWINAHNAVVLKRILDGTDGDPAVSIAGKQVTLKDMEQRLRVLAKGDARVWCALYEGPGRGPPLVPLLFRGNDLAEALATVTHIFLSDKTRNRFDLKTRTAHLSPLFERRRSDFEAGRKGAVPPLQIFLADHAPAPAARSLRTDHWTLLFDATERPSGPPLFLWLAAIGAAVGIVLAISILKAKRARK